MPTDEALLARVAQQDREALEHLYDRYERPVYGLAMRCSGDRFLAEEIVQDVFAKIWRFAGSFDPKQGKASTWILTMTRRQAIDRFRSQARRQQETPQEDEHLAEWAESFARSPDAAEATSLRLTLREALSQLNHDQRLVIERIYYQGYTQQEVADQLGIPLGTVKGRVRLGMARLREWLTSSGWEQTV